MEKLLSLRTRKASGKVSWPIVLVAGRYKAGKSWMAAEATGSNLVSGTYWLPIGELDPDEYRNVPGAGDFDIVEHDGTFSSILQAVAEIASLPRGDKPTLLVIDSGSRLRDLIRADMQEIANARAKARNNGQMPAHPVDLTSDLWYLADTRWAQIMQGLRLHDGPVIITARVDSWVKNDGDRIDRMQIEKTLPYDADVVVELPQRGEKWLTGVRSTRLTLEASRRDDELTIQRLWESLGLTGKVAQRSMTELKAVPQ